MPTLTVNGETRTLPDGARPRTLPLSPPYRSDARAIWTGNSMLLFGGLQASNLLPDDIYAYSLSRPMYLYQKP